MKENKRVVTLAILAISILVAVGIGISYAFFIARIDTEDGNIKVETNTSSEVNVEYNPADPIVLLNAEPGDSKTTTFSISLTASNKTADTAKYGLVWDISKNEFLYEPENPADPQLVYSLYYSNDNETWTPYVENADCTTWQGKITLVDEFSITANAGQTSTEYWKFTLTYKAYDYNQATNMSKKFNGTILLDADEI